MAGPVQIADDHSVLATGRGDRQGVRPHALLAGSRRNTGEAEVVASAALRLLTVRMGFWTWLATGALAGWGGQTEPVIVLALAGGGPCLVGPGGTPRSSPHSRGGCRDNVDRPGRAGIRWRKMPRSGVPLDHLADAVQVAQPDRVAGRAARRDHEAQRAALGCRLLD